MNTDLFDLIREKCLGKSVVLLGFGREGQATYSVLRRIFPEVLITIADTNVSVRENPILSDDKNLEFLTGPDFMDQLGKFDLIFRSPGIPIWHLLLPNQDKSENPDTCSDTIPGTNSTSNPNSDLPDRDPKAPSTSSVLKPNAYSNPRDPKTPNANSTSNPNTDPPSRDPKTPGTNLTSNLSSNIQEPGREIRNPGSLYREKITSQTDLFLQAYASQVIGVTGTKGKSTTSSLIHHILKTAGCDCILAGNIGNPVFHFIDQITPETRIVFELSSHQLEYIRRGPAIAVFLNVFQEHLDAYESYETYMQSKQNITRFQHEGDDLIYNAEDPLVASLVTPFIKTRRVHPFSLQPDIRKGTFVKDSWIWFADEAGEAPVWKIHQDRFLRGEHNLKNIMAAINVAKVVGVDNETIEDGIGTFKGLEHRLEYVGEFRGIHFYNDSIATIPEACIEAVRAIPGVDTLVAGGFDRGIDYGMLGAYLCKSGIRTVILIGAAGKRIGREMELHGKGAVTVFYINRFDDFQPIAFRETRPGKACLLSPAAASYDEFKNFEERGKRFRELVRMGG